MMKKWEPGGRRDSASRTSCEVEWRNVSSRKTEGESKPRDKDKEGKKWKSEDFQVREEAGNLLLDPFRPGNE